MDEIDLYAVISAEVEKVSADYAKAITDGSLSPTDAITIGYFAAQRFHQTLHNLAETTRAQRKDAWLKAVDRFSTKFTKATDIPYVPEVVENTFVDPAINQLARAMAEGLFSLLEKLADEAQAVA